jgi:hypothetical protein
MNKIAGMLIFMFIAISSRAEDGEEVYRSRYQEWMPHVTNTLVVTMQVGKAPMGLWSGSFSTHVLFREADAKRADGTPIAGHAVVTVEGMKTLLRLIDEAGPHASFSTCNDENWREPLGEPTRIKVVWKPDAKGYKYDWFILPENKMVELLQKLQDAFVTRKPIEIVEALTVGYKTRLESEKIRNSSE